MECPSCGYDLGSGMLPARCPKCGHNLANLADAPRGAAGAAHAAEMREQARAARGPQDAAPEPGRRVLPLVVAGLLGVLALAGVVLAFNMQLFGGHTIPDVVGWNSERATRDLEQLGCTVTTTEEKADGQAGMVLAMDPAPGGRAEGAQVTLTISVERVMPEVVGKTQAEAEELMKAEGINWTVETRGDDGPEGMVLECNRAAGKVTESTVEVVLTVSAARTVPDLSGMNETQATKAVEDAGYKAHVTYVKPTDEHKEADEVAGQNPAPGTKIKAGETVEIQVVRDLKHNEEAAQAIVRVIYDCDPSDSAIGGGLRPYLSPELDAMSDHDLWYSMVKLGGGHHGVAGPEFQRLVRHVDSINDVSIADDGVVAVTFTVTWDWSRMGSDYAGVTSTDTRTVYLRFNDDGQLVDFYDGQTDVPLYDLE